MPAGSAKTKKPEGGGVPNTLQKTPEERLEAAFSHIAPRERKLLIEAFKDAPEGILQELEKHGEKLQFTRSYSSDDRAFYSYDKGVVIFIMYDHSGLLETVRHEVGHFIDHMNGPDGWTSSTESNKALSDALKRDRAGITGRGESKAALREAAKNAMKPSSEFYNHGAVSDIFSNITEARIEGKAGHSKSYYKEDPSVWKAEVYANLFDIYAHKDHKAVSFVKKFFPNIINEFEKMYNK